MAEATTANGPRSVPAGSAAGPPVWLPGYAPLGRESVPLFVPVPPLVPGTTAMAESLGLADGEAVGLDVAPLGVAVGAVVPAEAPAEGLADAVGALVAAGLGRGVGVAVGRGVAAGFGVGFGVGLGVGFGVGGTVMVSEPPPSVSVNRSRLIASKVTVCVPAGSLPDHAKRTPVFQFVPLVLMVCVLPATRTRTQSAGDPSRFR
jgi:hypothetical protein